MNTKSILIEIINEINIQLSSLSNLKNIYEATSQKEEVKKISYTIQELNLTRNNIYKKLQSIYDLEDVLNIKMWQKLNPNRAQA